MIADNEVEILLVEDNQTDAELTIRALKKRNLANSLEWVRDGAEALDFIFAAGKYAGRNMNNTPKVILLDLRLPKVDGLEVLQKIKSDERTKRIPVIILTSSNEERDITESYKLGVNSFINKPVEFGIFSETVAKLGFYWLLMNKPANLFTEYGVSEIENMLASIRSLSG
jgi:CheY-like chemotaxis protein